MHVTKLPKTEGIALARHYEVLNAAIREAMAPFKYITGYEIIEGVARYGLYLPLADETSLKFYTPADVTRAILLASETAVYRPVEHSINHKGWEVRRGVLVPAMVIWAAWIS